MGRKNIILGSIGETIAADYLKKLSYHIMYRNYLTPFGEIDIIAKKGKTVVIAEVKTRISEYFGPPHLSITEIKKNKIIKNALFFLKEKKALDKPSRIDVISIKLNPDYSPERIQHFANAFDAK